MSHLKNNKEKIAKAKPGIGRGFLNAPGIYRVRIDGLRETTSRNGAPRVFNDFTIVESGNPSVPVGSERSQYISLLWDGWERMIRTFLDLCCEAQNPDADEEKLAELKQALAERTYEEYNEECTVEGVELQLEIVPIVTDAGKDFSKHVWSVPPVKTENPYAA